MSIAVRVEPLHDTPSDVEYRWDTDTDILTANLRTRVVSEGTSGSVEIEGSDGSWLILDVADGRIHGVEVAVWPEVQMRGALKPPATVEDGRVIVPARRSQSEVAALEVETALRAEADSDETVFHFTLGKPRRTRAIRLARDLLIEVDAANTLAGLWLLNVPPFRARV